MSWVLSLSPKEEENPDWRFSRTHLERVNTNEGPQAVHHTEREQSWRFYRSHLERANTNEGPQTVCHTAERDESWRFYRSQLERTNTNEGPQTVCHTAERDESWRFYGSHLERANTNEGPQTVCHTAEREESCQVKRQRTWDQSQPWSLSQILLLWPVLSCTMRSWLHFCGSSFYNLSFVYAEYVFVWAQCF